jgi:hypothetical protein
MVGVLPAVSDGQSATGVTASCGAAGQLFRNGGALEQLPAVAAGFSDGVVTAEQVAVVAPVAVEANRTAALEQGVDLAQVDAVLAETVATRQYVQLADTALASGNLPILRTVKPQIVVTIGVEDLVDPSTGPGAATTGFGALLSAARARWAACDGTVTRLVLDPDGRPLDYGRSKRLVPPHLRRAVEHRDRHGGVVECAERRHRDPHPSAVDLVEWSRPARRSLLSAA